MKLSKYNYTILDGKFSIAWVKDLDHRRELVITLPNSEYVLGFDW